MSLSISLTKVKEKCAISGTTYDSKISSLIGDWLPAIEFAIDPAFVADISNTGLQATLNLGATELVAGEFLAQLGRETGASEPLFFGWLELQPAPRNLADPYGLKSQGAARLQPYLKSTNDILGSIGVLAGGSREGE